MKKTIFVLISFVVCAFSGVFYGWIWLFPIYFLFSSFKISNSVAWEIPIGALMASVLMLFFPENTGELFRCLIFLGSMALSFLNPKKLFLFFPLCVFMLFLKNDSAGIYALTGAFLGSLHKNEYSVPQIVSQN